MMYTYCERFTFPVRRAGDRSLNVVGLRPWILVALVILSSSRGFSQSSDGYYAGTIGGKYRIQMQVQSGMNEGITRWWGMYFYESIGDPILLTGAEDDPYTVLDETVGSEKTGSFRGILTAERFEGTWINAKTKKELPFSLERVAVFERVSDYSEGWSIEFNYPIFNGAGEIKRFVNETAYSSTFKAFEAQLKMFRDEHESGGERFDASRTHSIRFANDRLVSCLIERSEYTGGAHGNTSFEVLNVGFKNGAPSVLDLEDLFQRNSGFMRVLSGAGMKQLAAQKAAYVEDGSITELTLSMLLRFTLTPKGFHLHFAPYQVGPYADGPLEVVIPWQELSGIISQDGPLATFLKPGK